MIENPEIVAHLDVESVLKSKALRRTGLDSNPKIPYISDAEDVIFISDSLDLTAPRFLAIINLKRDYRVEFIANLFRNGVRARSAGTRCTPTRVASGAWRSQPVCLNPAPS